MSKSEQSDADSERSNLLLQGASSVTPGSSPLQQVPGSARSSRMSYTEDMSMHDGNVPYLVIVTQPQNHFRFRYKTERESGTHGCLQGKTKISGTTKTYPTVQLKNCTGFATIKCKLYQHDRDVEHPHLLHEDDEEISFQVPREGSYIVCFRGLGIIHTAKRDLPGLLYNKREKSITKESNKITKKELREECKKAAKLINLNAVRLRFSAHDSVTDKEICEPVFSEIIYNMKSPETNVLKICGVSRRYGKPTGGDNVFLFVEKVQKGNVRINVFEKDADGIRRWEMPVRLLDNNIHYQTGIRFSTPPYRDPETPADVEVYIELQRVSDGSRSNSIPFIYKAEIFYKIRKRPKYNASPSYTPYSPASSIPSVSDTSSTGLKTTLLPIENELFTHLRAPNLSTQSKQYVDQSTQTSILDSPHSEEYYSTLMFNGNLANIPADIEIQHNDDSLAQGSTFEEYYVMPMDYGQDIKEVLPALENNLINNPVLGQPNVPSPVSQHVRTESSRNNDNADTSDLEQFFKTNWQEYMAPYVEDDEDFQLNLVPDSGRTFSVKEEQATSSKDHVKKELIYFKAREGLEVKKLIKDICELKQNKPRKWDVEVREKLDRLFDIRLSNGDTFLHMTITDHLPSFKFVVNAIQSVNMSYLLDEANHELLTILHLAVIHDMPDTVAYLIEKGCDPMCLDKDRNTAFHHAVMCAFSLKSLLEAVKKKGCKYNLNQCNYEQQTPLHLAAVHGRAESARLLLEHGADRRLAVDHHGRTPLHIAVQNDDKELVATLLQYVPVREVDVANWLGMTALQIVCSGDVRQHTLEIIKLLLDKGAAPTITERDNEPAYKMAKRNPQMWELMQKYLSDYYTGDDHSTDDTDDEFQSADEGLDDNEAPLDEVNAKLKNLEPFSLL